jgi:hypothetical protein
LSTPDSASRGVVFRLRISLRIRSQNRNCSKCTVKDLSRTDLCKNPRISSSLPYPFKSTATYLPWATLCHSRLYPAVRDLGLRLWSLDYSKRRGSLLRFLYKYAILHYKKSEQHSRTHRGCRKPFFTV